MIETDKMTRRPKKEYVSISCRIPKDVHDEMVMIRDCMGATTNQMVIWSIDDFTTLAKRGCQETDHVALAGFAFSQKKKTKS
jgi:uracil phosphoribosyltransferase